MKSSDHRLVNAWTHAQCPVFLTVRPSVSFSMYVCLRSVCMYVCMYVCTCASVHDYVRVCTTMCECPRLCVSVHDYVRVCTTMCVCAQLCACVHDYVRVCRYLYVCFNRYLAHTTDDPLVGSVATQYIHSRDEHDRIAREWTKKYAT